MPQLSDIEAQYRSRAYRFLGSFWNNIFADKDSARALVDLTFRTSIAHDIESLYASLAGIERDAALTSFVDVPFDRENIFQSGMMVYDDPDQTPVYDEAVDNQIYDAYRVKYWVLPLSQIWPLRIQTKFRTLILGTDFFLDGGKWIFFRRDPRILFADNYYTVVQGLDTQKISTLDFFTRLRVTQNRDLITKWLRSVQTPKSFYLALAASAGLGIIRKGGELLSMVTTATGVVIYTFPEETVTVNYLHTPLQLRKIYDPDTVIGDVVKVYRPREDQTRWWREIDWQGGIILDPIVPQFKGLTLLDKESFAYVAGQDDGSLDGSLVHARVALTPDFYKEDPYWRWVAQRETLTGFFLNGLLQLPEEVDSGNPAMPDTFDKALSLAEEANEVNHMLGLPPEQPALRALPNSYQVNPLDVFFEAFLGKQAMVITIDMSRLRAKRSLMSFLSKHTPVGATPIIFGYLSNGPREEVIIGENLIIDEIIEIMPSLEVTVTDEFDLSSTVDYVELTPIYPNP